MTARKSHVFHRVLGQAMPTADRGDGVYIVDTEGKRYLDASGGAAVSCLGHSHPAVLRAIHEQADRIPFAHTGFFTSQPAEDLADFLAARAPGGLDYVYYVSGGSEAAETAIKMARQYFVETGEPDRRHVLARWQGYHGNTLGALAAGGNRPRRKAFGPVLAPVFHHLTPCYAYRYKGAGESGADFAARLADELDATIRGLGPGTVAAFFAETVVGATSGAVPPVPGYFKAVREVCDRHGVLLVLDEVMCGMGRTGTLFACEQEEVVPDIVITAKGLGAGYQPIGAAIVRGAIHDAFVAGSGAFMHGHTYMGHPMACAAALAVQRAIEDDGLLANVRRQGAALDAALRAAFGQHPHVGDIRGRGLILGIELVADRATAEPFDPALRLHARIKRAAMERGLICYPGGGTIDGERGDHVLLAPPFILEDEHVPTIVERLGAALDAALESMERRA